MSSVLQFNQQQAIAGSAGSGDYITESTVVSGRLVEAKWIASPSGAKSIEFSFESDSGKKANYLSIFYGKKNGSANDIGIEQLQAMMGVLGVQNLSDQGGYCPEVKGKPIMLALERENYTKQSGAKAGEEGFRFNIKAFMSAKSRQTYAEHVAGKDPETAIYWSERFASEPMGKKQQTQAAQPNQQAQTAQGGQYNASNLGASDFNDEIPW